jgi:hypothetical protein
MALYDRRGAMMSRGWFRKVLMRDPLATGLLVFFASAGLWSGAILVERQLLPDLSSNGNDVFLLATGVRLLLLLVGGVWAAVGISLSALAMLVAGGGDGAPGYAVLFSLIAGFGPYVSLAVTSRSLGIDKNLSNLSSLHLPLIALGVAAGTSILHAAALWLSGSEPLAQLPGLVLAMASVDFLGCLITIYLLSLGLGAYRRWQRRST